MKQRLFVIIVASAIFIIAVWLLQTAAQNARPQLRPLPQPQSTQDNRGTEIDLGEQWLNENKSREILLSLSHLAVFGQIIHRLRSAMTRSTIYEFFKTLDIDDLVCVAIKLLDRSYYQIWIINEIHCEPEGIYVQYFPFRKGEVQLAFIAPNANSDFGITAVKHLELS